MRKFLFNQGFRYRKNVKNLPGTPDIVLPKYKTIIIVNGCFWHAHEGCKYNRMPQSRQDYWIPKIYGNVARDVKNIEKLKKLDWRVLIVWECELKKSIQSDTLFNLIRVLKSNIL